MGWDLRVAINRKIPFLEEEDTTGVCVPAGFHPDVLSQSHCSLFTDHSAIRPRPRSRSVPAPGSLPWRPSLSRRPVPQSPSRHTPNPPASTHAAASPSSHRISPTYASERPPIPLKTQPTPIDTGDVTAGVASACPKRGMSLQL